MADVFISYKSGDREIVRKLARHLQERGYTVWWDNRLEWGGRWDQSIKRALDASKAVVVLWTPKSVHPDATYVSTIVLDEALIGAQKGALLPVIIGDVKPPFPHGAYQGVNLTAWHDGEDDAQLQRILGSISQTCGPPKAPPPDVLTAWIAAEDANHADAFVAFAKKYPDSRLAEDAQDRAAECEMRTAHIGMGRDAAAAITKRFALEIGKPKLTVSLPIKRKMFEDTLPFPREELLTELVAGRRAVLEAEPGGGKTTALLDFANILNQTGDESIGVYFRLKPLAARKLPITEYLEALDSDRLIKEATWHAFANGGQLVVLCDGWNELNDDERDIVKPLLNDFCRDYPNAGVLVGTRPIAPPPLRGEHLSLSLARLSSEDIRLIVRDRLGAGADAALAEIRGSDSLRELVRIPFFLGAFCVTRQAGNRASTREALIGGMLTALASKDEHATELRRGLKGHQDKYLRNLASDMVRLGVAELELDGASISINQTTENLSADGIAKGMPDASAVLSVLCAHHCLIEAAGDAEPTYRFTHQLIQEWYAADEVRRVATLALSDATAATRLDAEILNNRTWTEPALFAAERPVGDLGIPATAHMILRALGIDAGFAAEMIGVAPDDVWKLVAKDTKRMLEEWGKTSRSRIVQFIIACGRPELSAMLWDAITGDGARRPSQELHSHRFPYPQVLGSDWLTRLKKLDQQSRRDILYMLASNSGLVGARMAVVGVRGDVPKVQVAVAEMLSFYRFESELNELLKNMDDKAWEGFVRRGQVEEIWAEPWRGKALEAAKRAFKSMEGPPKPERLFFAMKMRKQGEAWPFDFVTELSQVKFENSWDNRGIYEQVAEIDAQGLSDAIVSDLLAGKRSHPTGFVLPNAKVDQAQLLDICRKKADFYQTRDLAKLLVADSVTKLLAECLSTAFSWREEKDHKKKSGISDHHRAIADTLHHVDKRLLANAVLEADIKEAWQIGELSDVLMRAYRADHHGDPRAELDEALRGKMTCLLQSWADLLRKNAPEDRGNLHRLAEAIATFPSPDLLPTLRELVVLDSERWRAEKEEFTRDHKAGRLPRADSGARMSYAFRYAQNMIALATGRDADVAPSDDEAEPSGELTATVIETLKGFLLDREFGGDAARAIGNLKPSPYWRIEGRNTFGPRFDFAKIEERRLLRAAQGVGPLDRDAAAILDAMASLKAEATDEAARHAEQLVRAAARMECGERESEVDAAIYPLNSVEATSNYLMVRAQLGQTVDGGIAETCLDQLDARRGERKWEYSESWYKWEELLVLMILGGKVEEAAARLLKYDTRTKDYELRSILLAVANSGHPAALETLLSLRELSEQSYRLDDWLRAIAKLGTTEAADQLLSLMLGGVGKKSSYGDRDFAASVARVADEHSPLADRVLELATNNSSARPVIAAVISRSRSEEFLLRVLDLKNFAAFAGPIADVLHQICVEDHAIEGQAGEFERLPHPIPRVRAKLFAKAALGGSDADVAVGLLQTIDDWRDGYDDPWDEERHPDLTVEMSWPPAAQVAWDSAVAMRKKTA